MSEVWHLHLVGDSGLFVPQRQAEKASTIETLHQSLHHLHVHRTAFLLPLGSLLFHLPRLSLQGNGELPHLVADRLAGSQRVDVLLQLSDGDGVRESA